MTYVSDGYKVKLQFREFSSYHKEGMIS